MKILIQLLKQVWVKVTRILQKGKKKTGGKHLKCLPFCGHPRYSNDFIVHELIKSGQMCKSVLCFVAKPDFASNREQSLRMISEFELMVENYEEFLKTLVGDA